MTIRCGVLMDPIESIHFEKDTTLALLYEAQQRDWEIYYMTADDIYYQDGTVRANCQRLAVAMNPQQWFRTLTTETLNLNTLDVLLMRKDPPFDIQYIYITHLLDIAAAQGVLVVNRPQSLRDYNEKLATSWFPQCCPPTLVSRDHALLRQFLEMHEDVVFKPLAGMGGRSVFRVNQTDVNVNVILETLVGEPASYIMAQKFIPDIAAGDKRILLVDGQPIPYALARIPAAGDSRGNLAAGAIGKGVELTDRDRWICQQVGPTLQEKGLFFVGLDVIGDFLTEINITSPTCIREIDAAFQVNLSRLVLDALAAKL